MLTCPECFFAICPVPMWSGAQVPICPRCSFTLNSPYLQMPSCLSAIIFSNPICLCAHFPQMRICPKCPIFRDPNVWDPAFVRDPYCLIRSLAVLQTISCDSIQSNAVLYKRFLAVPHGLINGSMWYPLVP